MADPTQNPAGGPLVGLRVLDMATMLAGPYGATLLGDLGADVVKVESQVGDDSRHLGPERDGEHSPFLSLNRNKRSLVLDLRQAAAQEVFGRLLRTSDVLITNVREPALSRLGSSYAQVCRHRPDIIWVGVTAFGPDGPYAGRPGIDFLAQGFAGLLAMTGERGGAMRPAGTQSGSSAMASSWSSLIARSDLLSCFAIGFLILFTFIGTFTYVNFYLTGTIGLSPMQLGFVYFVFIPSIIATPFAGHAARRDAQRLEQAIDDVGAFDDVAHEQEQRDRGQNGVGHDRKEPLAQRAHQVDGKDIQPPKSPA